MTHTLTKPTSTRFGRLFVTLLLLAIPTTVDATTMICSTTTLMLIFMIDIVEAVFTPNDYSLDLYPENPHGDPKNYGEIKIILMAAICRDSESDPPGCLDETPDGSCPIFAASPIPDRSENEYNSGINGGPGNYGPIGSWDVSNVIDMKELFGRSDAYWGCFDGTGAFNADISKWNTERVTNMDGSTLRAAY